MTRTIDPSAAAPSTFGSILTTYDRAAAERVQRAVMNLHSGKPVVLLDRYDSPRRGDIVQAATHTSTETAAFVIRHTSGFLQVALPSQRCEALQLGRQRGADNGAIEQCVSVDAAAGIGTGISAADRATTIRLLSEPTARAETFTRPGHIVPLSADVDRPLCSFGFADAASYLVARAELAPSALLATIIQDPPGVDAMSAADLHRFSVEKHLAAVGIDDLYSVHSPRLSVDIAMPGALQRTRLIRLDDSPVTITALLCGNTTGPMPVTVQAVPDIGQMAAAPINGGPQIYVAFNSDTFDVSWPYIDGYLHRRRSALLTALHHAGVGSVRVVGTDQRTFDRTGRIPRD